MVGLGAIPGAWLRLRVVNHFEPLVPRKHWGTFLVNLVAAFSLGLVLGLQRAGLCNGSAGQADTSALILMVGTGFFGSLSTFSTFAVEVLVTLRERRWREAALLTTGSVMVGLFAAAAGFSLGLIDA